MKEDLFRKKSLDRIKSPESLDDYIRVSNPAVWLLLVSAIVLLAGACIWGFFGHIDSTVNTSVHVENGSATCYIPDDTAVPVKTGMTVKFDDFEATVSEIGKKDESGFPCVLELIEPVADGVYDGKIITERIRPLSFVFN